MKKIVFDRADPDPAKVMPVGAGDVGAMISVRERGVALLLSQSEFLGIPVKPAHEEYPRHLLSPGEITLFADVSHTEMETFRQELDLDAGCCRLAFSRDGKRYAVTVSGDLAKRQLVVDVAGSDVAPIDFAALRPGAVCEVKKQSLRFTERNADGAVMVTTLEFDAPVAVREVSPTHWEICPAGAAYCFTIACENPDAATPPPATVPWKAFFDRSKLELAGDEFAETLAALWKLDLYSVQAFDGRIYPARFSGGVGTVRGDDRYWGSFFWFQNQRELLWPLGAANHLELLRRHLDHLDRLYDFCRELAQKNGYDGLYLPEMMPYLPEKEFTHQHRMTPFTTGLLDRARPNRLDDQPSGWVSHILSNGGEFLLLMLDYLQYSGDRDYFTDVFAPDLHEIALFYLEYLKMGEDGLYHFAPAHADEMFRKVVDPAGSLCAVRLALLAVKKYGARLRFEPEFIAAAGERLAHLAPLPVGREAKLVDWKKQATWIDADVYSPMKDFIDDPLQWNVENPELYVVYPFAAVDAQSPDAEFQRAVRTFRRRRFPCTSGWSQCPVQAARLALPDTADIIKEHWRQHQKYPYGGWNSPGATLPGSRFDVSCHPYLDSAGVNACAVNEMLLQSHHLLDDLPDDPCEGGALRIIPAVPSTWSGSFTLLARGGFLVSADFARQKVTKLIIKSLRGNNLRIVSPIEVDLPTKAGETIRII